MKEKRIIKEKKLSNHVDGKLLAKYLSSECSTDEEKIVRQWSQQDIKNTKILKLLTTFWNQKKIPPQKSDVNKYWKQMVNNTGINSTLTQPKEVKIIQKASKEKIIQIPVWYRNKRLLRYTAILLSIIALPFLWRAIETSFFTPATEELKKILVSSGQKKKILLPDGTKVILDSGTHFRYPLKFKKKIREVFLNGEGYFEVHSNVYKPFVVRANKAIIKVVGTKFNVRAWKDTQKVKVAVTEGKVSLNSEGAKDDDKVIIIKGHLSVLPDNGKPSKPYQGDLNKELSWINREMAFENVPLAEVLKQLERWYGIKFNIADDISDLNSLTVFLQNESLGNILKLLVAITGLKYRLDGNIVCIEKE
jgi:ferric-dicitrate binding protein FerR (iron transport regulator)